MGESNLRVLVTGGSGLLGSALKRVPTDHELVFSSRLDADLRVFSQVVDLLQRVQPDALIHGAALVGGIGGNSMKSGSFFFENSQINLNVLEAARQNDIKTLISFMSTCVFPDKATYPLRAEALHNGPPHNSNFGYAYSKRMLEVQSRSYNRQWDTNYQLLVPTNMYGPHDNFSLLEGHVVPALIHKMFLAQQSGGPLQVWGSGKALREFVFVDDVASIVLKALDMSFQDPLIISPARETAIGVLVDEIAELSEFDGQIIFDSSKPDGQLRKPSDPSEFVRKFPSFEFTELREGLSETIQWFQENYPSVRM